MSLTNPNKVVTEQRLNEYHNAILPYLGGMPEMIANKFSKGDLYSTEERMIGQWIDGKPLYQKTVSVTTPNSSEYTELSLSMTDVANAFITNGSYIEITSGSTLQRIPINNIQATTLLQINSSGTLSCIVKVTDTNWRNRAMKLTLQYTKTTDSPISIGSDTDYSTEEKIVGTWIDGKPLYQKTISGTTGTAGSFKTIAHNISNISEITFINGVVQESSTEWHGAGCADALNQSIRFDASTTNVSVYVGHTALSNKSVNITIQYTKTTD